MKKKVLGLIGALEIELQGTEDIMALDLAGQIDSYSAEEVSKLIEAHIHNGKIKVVVDLDKITYLDSAGLSMFIKNKISLSKKGGDLRIVGLKGKAKEVFELAGLLGMFGIYDSREKAFEGF
jgi:anti-sigma B factor antagonist